MIGHPLVRAKFAMALAELAERSTGSSNHVARALLLAEVPDIDKGEITDKGSINQRAVLTHRPDHAASLYAEAPGPGIFVFDRRGLRE
ncbi:feruloyl-CoA synthase [compost metagenome]